MAQQPPGNRRFGNFIFPQPQLPNQTQPSASSSVSDLVTTSSTPTSTSASSLSRPSPSAPTQGQALIATQAALTTTLGPAQAPTSSLSPPLASAPAQGQALTAAQAGIAAQASAGFAEPLMYKNRLQEYAQKSGIQLPVYQTVNEGFQHSPMFRATVYVDGDVFTSPDTFSQRKAAEQSAAKIALESVLKKIKDEGCPLIYVDVMFCKSILNEFAVKMNMEKPTYNTIRHEGQIPVFVSSLSFNGVLYTSDPSKSKKEAEQLAARAVILSLLGKSEYEVVLSQIIRSKVKLLPPNKVKQPCSANASIASPMINIGHNASTGPEKDKGAECTIVVNARTAGGSVQPVSAMNIDGGTTGVSVQPASAMNVNAGTSGVSVQPVSATNVNTGATGVIVQPVSVSVPTSTDSAAAGVVVDASSGIHWPHHEFRTVKSEPLTEVNNLPNPASQAAIRTIEFIHEVGEQPIGDVRSSAKRKRKSRKKANKRMQAEAQLAIAALPLNQAPACSVSQ